MKIVIDTNTLYEDYLLRGAALVSLSKSRERAGCALLVPEVVVAEHVKHFRDARRMAASQLKQASRDVKLLFGVAVDTPDAEALPDDCDARIRRRLEELGIRVVPYPTVPHERVAARAVERKPPFLKDGSGYQDSLIWLSVLDLLTERQPILLVSDDKGFGAKDLHESLADEANGPAPGIAVLLAKNLTDAFEKHVRPRLDRLDKFEASLASGQAKLNLAEWLVNNLAPLVHDHETREATKKHGGLGFEWGFVERAKFMIRGAHAVSDRDAYVRVSAQVTARVGKWEWFQVGEDDFDRDWMEDEIDATVELELVISDEENVSSPTVLSVTPSAVVEPREPDEFDG